MTKANGLDPITVEVVRHKLEGIANEMQQTLLRSSFSPIVKEGLDASSSLFTIRGETLAQALAEVRSFLGEAESSGAGQIEPESLVETPDASAA